MRISTTAPAREWRISYRQHSTRCNNPRCRCHAAGGLGHGPYRYAVWQENGRLLSRCLGRSIDPAVTPSGTASMTTKSAKPGPAVGSTRGGGTLAATRPSAPPGNAATGLRVRTLGSFVVWRDRSRLPPGTWSRKKVASLFKVLLTAPGQRLHRDQVMELLWPMAEPSSTANNLRFTLHQLRAALDPPHTAESYVQSRDGQLLLVPVLGQPPMDGAETWLDAAAFDTAASAALAGTDVVLCRQALALYTGDYLPDNLYDGWATARRDELAQRRLTLLVYAAHLASPLGVEAEIQAWAHVQAADACNEEAARALMRLLGSHGRTVEALRAYNVLAAALARELGLRPSAAAESLKAILSAPVTARAALAGPAGTEPEIASPPQPLTNIPLPITSIIGRDRDLASLREILGHTRLLTLTGVGGTGKTVLAVDLARDLLAGYADGVWLAELATLSDPALIPLTLTSALNLKDALSQKPSIAAIASHIRAKHILLMLDNCEHLLDSCAQLAAMLLAACPNLSILATSRERLRVPGEVTYKVQALPYPSHTHGISPEQALHFEAVQLFVARAQAQEQSFALTTRNAGTVAAICARLDGLPLAIELAAARVGTLPIDDLLTCLTDCFRVLTGGPRTLLPRQQTLRAALEWSHDLLLEQARVVLRRLSVFSGGWTLTAAEAVCTGSNVNEWEMPDLLASLVEKSLVVLHDRNDEARYQFLETVRQFARLKLDEAGDTVVTFDRHLEWCLNLAEVAGSGLQGPQQQDCLQQLAAEHDNMRAALNHAATGRTDPATGLRLAGYLWRYWLMSGHLSEGRRWLERLLAREGVAENVRARALDGEGALAAAQGAYTHARVCHEQSLAIWRALADKQGLAGALNNLGSILQHQGNYDKATAMHRESLALYEAAGDMPGMAGALNQLGCIERDAHQALGRAGELLRRSLALRQEHGDISGIAVALNNLGLVACYEGDMQQAGSLFQESLAIRQSLRDRRGLAICLGNLARVATRLEEYPRARTLWQRALTILDELEDTRGRATCQEGLAVVAMCEGEMGWAARLEGAAFAQHAGSVWPSAAALPASAEDALSELGGHHGEETCDQAWSEGTLLSLERTMRLAAVPR